MILAILNLIVFAVVAVVAGLVVGTLLSPQFWTEVSEHVFRIRYRLRSRKEKA